MNKVKIIFSKCAGMHSINLIKMRTIASIILMMVCFNAFGQTDFSGKWKIDIQRSVIEKEVTPLAISTVLEIIQQKDSISITRSNDSMMSSETLAFDGKPLITEQPNFTRAATVQWSGDKKTLVQRVKFEIKNSEIRANTGTSHTWTLSEDRRVLTLISVYEFSDGQQTKLQAVYVKH